jgi:hypothetical protein
MSSRSRRALVLTSFALLGSALVAQEEPEAISNWAAPLFWSFGGAERPRPEPGEPSRVGESVQAAPVSVPTAPLPLIGITPCRIADTRGNGFTGDYGPPILSAGVARSFALTGQCGIAATASAVSLNITVTGTQGSGFIKIYPKGATAPVVSTLNYQASQTVANAAVVPLGTDGAITVVAGVSGTQLIIDTNGYYDNVGLITQVSPGTGLAGGGTSGNVTLGIAAGGVTSTELADNAVTSPKIAANAVTAGAIAGGQVVKDVNGAHDSVTIQGNGSITVGTAGSTITVGGGSAPAGIYALGQAGDTTLIGAGYTEVAKSVQDFWIPTATTGAPAGRFLHTAVWTGARMIVWGGFSVGYTNTGGQYDPASDSWTATTTVGAPNPRGYHTAVWTGSKMIVWGGYHGFFENTGGQYDPVADSWTATTTTGAPVGRWYHSALWIGSRMVVWGGSDGASYDADGGRYDPAADSWTPTSTTGAPIARALHAAVWTGSRMIVWGGEVSGGFTNTGGKYDPTANSWDAGGTQTTGAPIAREFHSAIWDGAEMIVWGGVAEAGGDRNTGGRYDPVADSWIATSTVGAPSARENHTVVWTGARMIVWGGFAPGGETGATGGLYDPATDAWTATATSGAPAARWFHTAIWIGTRMIVWGGAVPLTGQSLSSGAQYSTLSLYVKN